MSISIIQTMVLTQITQIRSFLNLMWKPSRTLILIVQNMAGETFVHACYNFILKQAKTCLVASQNEAGFGPF